MIKRLLLGLGTITVVGGAAIFGTQALLSDSVTLTANTFSTGTVDLQISKDDLTYADTETGFTQTVFPGQSSTPEYFFLKNNASGVSLALSAQATVGGGNEIDPTLVTVEIVAVTGGGAIEPGATPVSQSLTAWATPTALGVPNLANNDSQRYRMTVSFNSSITDSGADSIFDFMFTGTQL